MNVHTFSTLCQRLTIRPQHAIIHFDNRPEPVIFLSLPVKLKRLMTTLPQNSPLAVCSGTLNTQRALKLQVTMGFDLQPGSLAARSAQLFQLHKRYP
eukprot:1151516-Pelagomonas_calceolata.AAC.1